MILLAFLMTAVLSGAAAEQESLLVLNNHHVRLEVRRSEGTWGETYAAYASRGVAHGARVRPRAAAGAFRDAMGCDGSKGFSGAVLQLVPDGDQSILLVAEQSGCRLSKRITLHGQETHFPCGSRVLSLRAARNFPHSVELLICA